MEIIYLPPENLIPYANNARVHSDEQINQIATSIKEFGFTNPVLIDKDNGIVAGHGRVLAAQKLGMNEVPTIQIAFMSETQKKAYILADNKIALNSGWDDELLSLELGNLDELGFDLNLLGFSDEEIEKMASQDEEEEKSEWAYDDGKPEQDSICQSGDTWKLGSHKLVCGKVDGNLFDADVIIRQWQEYTGKDAIHNHSNKTFNSLED